MKGVFGIQTGLVVDELEWSPILGRRDLARIVHSQPLAQIAGATRVELIVALGMQNVNIGHGVATSRGECCASRNLLPFGSGLSVRNLWKTLCFSSIHIPNA